MSDSDFGSVEFNKSIFKHFHWVPTDPTSSIRPHLGRIMKWNNDKCQAETLKNVTLDLDLPSCIKATVGDVLMASAKIKHVELEDRAIAHATDLVKVKFNSHAFLKCIEVFQIPVKV